MNVTYKKQYATKIPKLLYAYFFMIVIYAGMATPFTRSMMSYNESPIAFLVPIIFTLFIVLKYKVSFSSRGFYRTIGVLLLWVFLQLIKYNAFPYTLTFFLFYNVTIAYILVQLYGVHIFILYEKIVVWLSIVAIIGWILTVVLPGPFTNIMQALDIGTSRQGGTIEANAILYSLTNNGYYSQYFLPRNSGFSWEPGRYAVFVVIAIFCNFIRTKFTIFRNYNFWILLVALLTTLSTTGYVGLLVVVLFYLQNQKGVYKALIYVPGVFLISYVFTLSFVGDKISEFWFDTKYVKEVSKNVKYTDGAIVPQRFDGLTLEFLNIFEDPILGYGIDQKKSFVQKKISEKIFLSNGLLKVFATFGVLIGAIFYLILYRSSKWMSQYYKYKGSTFYFILFLTVSVSYSFTQVPLFLAISFFPLFMKKNGLKFFYEK